MIYVPEGMAQGCMTFEDHTEINRHTSQYFNAQAALGVCFDDPAFGTEWPLTAAVISEQDRNWS
jgi:dTDP-4-dehydrorhamnose 3,5-epimerase